MTKRDLSSLGISPSTAMIRNRDAVEQDKSELLFTESSIPDLLARDEIVQAPTDTGARVWYAIRKTQSIDDGTGIVTNRRNLIAVQRGAYDGMVHVSNLGKLDLDGLLTEE